MSNDTPQAPSPEEVAKQKKFDEIKAQFNNMVDVKETNFSFKTTKTKDSVGNVVESKRATVVIPLPTLSVEGIIDVLQHGTDRPKELELLLEAVQNVVADQARELLNTDANLTSDNFPIEKLAFAFIANLPAAERRGIGIAKELWEEFQEDYIAVMPAAINKDVEKVTVAAKILASRYATIKFRKDIIKHLDSYMDIWVNTSPNAEKFQEIYTFLKKKAKELLELDDSEMLASL